MKNYSCIAKLGDIVFYGLYHYFVFSEFDGVQSCLIL